MTNDKKQLLPPREYIYTIMMARSHELMHHNGHQCNCKAAKMTNGLVKLLEEHHNRVLSARSIEGVITSLQFERLWGASTDEQKAAVKKLIEGNNKKSILVWMREHPSIDLGEKPIRDLYPIAKRLAIRNYSRLLRHELIAAIQREETNCGAQ